MGTPMTEPCCCNGSTHCEGHPCAYCRKQGSAVHTAAAPTVPYDDHWTAGKAAPEVSAGSPVTAGAPDTDACGCVEGYEWRARQDAVCGSCPRRGETPAGVPTTAAWRALAADWTQDSGAIRNALEDAWDALDAARGELVSARVERDALRVELAGVTPEGVEWQYRPWIPPAQRTADDWSSMVAVARNRAWAAEAELAAANARIAAVEALCDQWEYDTNADTAVAQLRDALCVPTAGEAGTAHG